MANVLPLLLVATGATLLFAGKKKGKRKSGGATSSTQNPLPAAPPPAEPLDAMAIEGLLDALGYPPGAIDGAYDADTATAVQAFRSDWNSFMEWMWKHNSKISPDTPGYGAIAVNGDWDDVVESNALRAYALFSDPAGTYVTIGGVDYTVENFRDMVLVSYENEPEVSQS